MNSSSERVFRSMALAVGLAGVAFGLTDAGDIIREAGFAALWWTLLAVMAFFGSFALLAALSFAAEVAHVRTAALSVGIGYLAMLILVPFAVRYGGIHAEEAWPYRYASLSGAATALAWPRVTIYVYLVLASAGAALMNGYAIARPSWLWYVGDFTRVVPIVMLMAICCRNALRMGDAVDRETALAEQQAGSIAAAEAREHESGRFAALIHDSVLSTLLDASRIGGSSQEVVVRQAKRSVAQLDEIRSTAADSQPDELDSTAVITLLRATVRTVNPEVGFKVHRLPGEELRLPAEVARVMAEALTEAIRNSLRHAGVPGRHVARTVDVTLRTYALRVVLTDDGAGFDVNAVPAQRLGISVSILGRMRRLPGGAGFIESQPGSGTTVTLVWSGSGDD